MSNIDPNNHGHPGKSQITDASPVSDVSDSDELEILIFETSPYGNIDAIVQHDRQTVYFYLHPRGNEDRFSPKACWVRNLIPGPYVINQQDFLDGRQVALPRTQTVSNQPGLLPSPDHLKVVWFEEGNGAALIELPEDGGTGQSKTLAVIPPWSGLDGFHGYAAECASDSPICWPLPKNPRMQQRIDRSIDFWDSFSRSPDPFVELRNEILSRYQTAFGNSVDDSMQYFDISGNRFPPRGMVRYELSDRWVLATVGMSLCPQPNVELSVTEPQDFRRIELAVELPKNVEQTSDLTNDQTNLDNIGLQIARMAAYPWNQFRWLNAGDTVQFPGIDANSDVVRLIEISDIFSDLTVCGDKVRLLWFVSNRRTG